MIVKKLFPHTVLLFVVAFATVALLYVLKPSVSKVENPVGAVISSTAATSTVATPAVQKLVTHTPLSHYIEIIDGCGPYYDSGTCVNVRSGPGTEFDSVAHLRTGIVLRVQSKTTEAKDGTLWYKVVQDRELRYPERVTGDWYVIADPTSVRPFDDVGDQRIDPGVRTKTTKRIVVNLTEKMIYAYEGGDIYMKVPISPGLTDTPTPVGTYTIFYKTPSRYMQGPIPGLSEQEYDLPGVPWDMYFTSDGSVIHGAYWHNHFGEKWSHGCVNMSTENAKKLYSWAVIGMPVQIKD